MACARTGFGPEDRGPLIDSSVIDSSVIDSSVIDSSVIDSSVIDSSVIDSSTDYSVDSAHAHTTGNLVLNGGCEEGLSNWTQVTGTNWSCGAEVSPQEGAHHFFAGVDLLAELAQVVSVTEMATAIDTGIQRFRVEAFVQRFGQDLDTSRVVLEYLDSTKALILDAYDSGDVNFAVWTLLSDTRFAPVGTRHLRLRLVAVRGSGSDNDGYFDNLSLTGLP
ncbi:MAG: hypothetical protein JRH20_27120 [Deltaproteobacteria bacterium]|nr:hypothetical protein [Deltaproteobacteria bacterium]